uniref:Uncharacterized protein n=1 Tax=Arundo donax TaxID=35708 RepID=A0A0A9B605_ARUDO
MHHLRSQLALYVTCFLWKK